MHVIKGKNGTNQLGFVFYKGAFHLLPKRAEAQ